MAVFLINTCKFSGCGVTFPTLTELIRHIEDTHLDFDPRVVEQHELQQPSCLPISYILRVFTDSRKDATQISGNHPIPRKLIRSHSPAPSFCSTTPTGSEVDDEDNGSESEESSIDSWSNLNGENDSTNAILKIMSPDGRSSVDDKDSKPYLCQIGGCRKRYRNANGLKYHTRNAHSNPVCLKKDSMSPTKIYKCHCGKTYKTPHGLKNHNNLHHTSNSVSISANSSQMAGLVAKAVATSTTSASKESILATFVRMKSLPNAASATSTLNTKTGLPIMLTLQAEPEIKREIEAINDKSKVNGNKCPIIAAPTLQQHLLSPIVAKCPNQASKALER